MRTLMLTAAVAVSLSLLASPAVQAKQETAKPTKQAKQAPSRAALRQAVVADLMKARKAKDKKAYEAAMKRMIDLQPMAGQYRYELAAMHASNDEKTPAYDLLLNLMQEGWGMKVEDDTMLKNIHGTEVWDFIVEGYENNRKPKGAVSKAFTVSTDMPLTDAIAYDSSRDAFLVGSAKTGEVAIVQADGSLKTLVPADKEHGQWSIFDVAVDAKRNKLWVASTALPHFQRFNPAKDVGKAGLFEYDLKTGKQLNAFVSPQLEGQQFFMSNLTVSPSGQVFVVDGPNDAFYTIEEGKLKRLLHSDNIGSMRDLAVSPDGKYVYIADHDYGLIGMNTQSGDIFGLGVGKGANIYGLEALVMEDDGHLLAVQNGMTPKRVVRLKLSNNRRGVSMVEPIAIDESLNAPTLMAKKGKALYVIGNSQKGKYDAYGKLKQGASIDPVQVLKVAIPKIQEQPQPPTPMAKPQAKAAEVN